MPERYIEMADGRRITLAADEYIVSREELVMNEEVRVAHFLGWLQASGLVDATLDAMEIEGAYWMSGAGNFDALAPA